MFTTREAVLENTGIAVDQTTLAHAQMMIEAYIGRTEQDVIDASDVAILGRAVTFQAIYIKGSPETWEQAAVASVASNGSTISFDTDRMAPHMSPWSVAACRNLSWRGSVSVTTGPMFDRPRPVDGWRYE